MVFRLLIVISIITILLFLFAAVVQFKDIFLWRWALKKELKALDAQKRLYDPPARQALLVVVNKARLLFTVSDIGANPFSDLQLYVRAIAVSYHPDSDMPELTPTFGHILRCFENAAPGIDTIMARPGFNRLSRINLKQIRKLHNDLTLFGRRPFLFTLWPLLLCRYLLIDIYLFIGLLAMDIYSERTLPQLETDGENLKETLTELSNITDNQPGDIPEEIARIRNRMIGIPSLLKADPNLDKLKKSIRQAAEIISEQHFPEAVSPLEEAKIGPLLSRFQSWLSALGKNDLFPASGKLLRLRLETVFLAGSLTETFLPKPVKKMIARAGKLYGLFRWPLNVYLWTSKGAFVKIAMDAGWFAGRKAVLSVIYGKAFDKACAELEVVYRLSTDD